MTVLVVLEIRMCKVGHDLSSVIQDDIGNISNYIKTGSRLIHALYLDVLVTDDSFIDKRKEGGLHDIPEFNGIKKM